MLIGPAAARQVARQARNLVQQASQDMARLMATDEEKSRLGDEYLGNPGKVKSSLSGGRIGTLKFDTSSGQVHSFRSESRRGGPEKFQSILKAAPSPEGMRYQFTDLGGWTSTTIIVNDRTQNWTVQKNALGLPIGECYQFGDLSQPESHWRCLEDGTGAIVY